MCTPKSFSILPYSCLASNLLASISSNTYLLTYSPRQTYKAFSFPYERVEEMKKKCQKLFTYKPSS